MNKLKNSRAASFVAVGAVYVLAFIFGTWIYSLFELPAWLCLLIADAAATVLTFIFSLIFGNASVYDPYWSVQPPVILLCYAIGHGVNLLGVMLLVAVCFWAVRLTANWAYTFVGLSHQDWRYTMLSEKTGVFYPLINFVGIHMVPTLVVYGCTLPAVFAIVKEVEPSPFSFVFIGVSIFAALMQGAADIQMHKYRKHRESAFIRVGLWKYSRHPNYLGEILMWWGVGLAVVVSESAAWYLLAGAALNTALFFFVSIPMADGRQSRKEGFAEYKRATRMLLPIKK